jgi:DNA-binding CsgD family transcriptional regulator
MSADHLPMTAGPVVLGVLNAALCVEDISGSVRVLLGHEPSDCLGAVALEAVHPDDLSAALFGLVQALRSGSSADLRVRLCARDRLWTAVRLVLAPFTCASRLRVGFAAAPEQEPARREGADRLGAVQALVHRLALELDAVSMEPAGRVPTAVAAQLAQANLTDRESQILGLLLDGQRVPAIARSMYVSRSTVRNHLCAIYRKLNVHSQAELLELLRPPGGQVLHANFSSGDPSSNEPSHETPALALRHPASRRSKPAPADRVSQR